MVRPFMLLDVFNGDGFVQLTDGAQLLLPSLQFVHGFVQLEILLHLLVHGLSPDDVSVL